MRFNYVPPFVASEDIETFIIGCIIVAISLGFDIKENTAKDCRKRQIKQLNLEKILFDSYNQIVSKILKLFGVSMFGQVTVRTRTQNFFLNFNFDKLPDGLPAPPPQLIYLVMKSYDKKVFYESSQLGEECIRNILKKNGLDVYSFDSILDFGCGCGRILRRWKTLGGKIYGSDYNPVLVNWCKKSLPFKVTMNKPQGKIFFDENKFDFIYAISVFTHLNENLQNFWIDELIRILKPGGYLLITVHGYANLRFRDHPDEKKKFESGEAIFVNTEYLGTNFCNSYHNWKI